MNTKMETTSKVDVVTKLSTQISNDILLRRRGKIFVPTGNCSNPNHVKAIGVNIASLGYTMSPELFKSLKTLSVDELSRYNNFLVFSLSKMVGAHIKYKPLFRNFPNDVPDVFEYWIDRVVGHFESVLDLTENAKLLSCGCLIDTEKWDMSNFGACPICQFQIDEKDLLPAKERVKLKGRIKLKTIDLGSEKEVFEIFRGLISSKTSISEQDKKDITSLFETYETKLEQELPEDITHKEVLAFVCPLVIKHFGSFETLSGKVKTAVDVLRVATAMSNGDVSLATNYHFRKFSKKERRFLLTLLEGCWNIKEDMVRHLNKWIRLGEILHPGDFRTRFPKSFEAFTAIRNGEKIETFNSKSEVLITGKRRNALINHLRTRPSELARKLDFIISENTPAGQRKAIKEFGKIAKSVPTTTLLQVMANFKIRTSKDKGIRIIMPKGNIAKVKVLDETRKPLTKSISMLVKKTIEAELLKRFKGLPAMGKVFIDPFLSEYVVPFSQRSASKALVTVARGSRITLPSENTVRMFLYWHEGNGSGRVDIDLSAVMFDEDWNYKEHISYTNYHGYHCTHSGDIQSAPNGAAEFIDIDKQSVLNYGGRYVVMNVFSFTGQKFMGLQDCFAGIMGRKNPNSGEIFEAKTVKQRFDISSETRTCLPLILDLKEDKLIWADISLPGNSRYNNIESNSKNISLMGNALCKLADFKPNIYELLHLHAKSRGKITKNIEKADETFTVDNVPLQFDRVMSEFLV